MKKKFLSLTVLIVAATFTTLTILAQQSPEEEAQEAQETQETSEEQQEPPQTEESTLEYQTPEGDPDQAPILDDDSPLVRDDAEPGEATEIEDIDWDNMGVSISPSSMHLNIRPGSSQTRDITVKNVTRQNYTFRVDFQDFEMTEYGRPGDPGPDGGRYSLSRYIGVNPSFFELEPGEEMRVRLNINIPDEEESYTAKWTIVVIEQVAERAPLDPGDGGDRLAMGVLTTFGFGVYVYQNPPNVILNQIDLTALDYNADDRNVKMRVHNTGDGISYCRSYLEITNLNTGEHQRLRDRNFTILPQYHREFIYELPRNLSAGTWSALGVVDYGSREEILAAEIEFVIE